MPFKMPGAKERYFLRDQLFFVRIAVIILQTDAHPQDHIRNGVTDQDNNYPRRGVFPARDLVCKDSINVGPSFLTTHVSQSGRYLFEAGYPEGTRAEASQCNVC
jgi:hypothetical protein